MTVVVSDTEYQEIQELLDEIKNEEFRENELAKLESEALERGQLEEFEKFRHDLCECREKSNFAKHCLSVLIKYIF